MGKLLTPKQVARAVGVSESTLKRWCDSGRVPVLRTAGGHRRLRQEDILRLVRDGKIPFENPDALGLPPASGKGDWTLARAAKDAEDAMLAGEYERLKQTAVDLFLCGHRLSTIFDAVFAPALSAIGLGWETGAIDVYQERRAVGITARAIHFMQQQLIANPASNAPLAIGGTADGDIYTLPTLMVEVALQEAGWRATNLGGPLPFASLKAAIQNQAPRIFWLSVSAIDDESSFVEGYASLFESCPATTALVIGGRALTPRTRGVMRFASHCEDLRSLVDFAQALQPMPAPLLGTAIDAELVDEV